MIKYDFNKTCNLNKLSGELKNLPLGYIESKNGVTSVFMVNELLTEEYALLSSIVSAHTVFDMFAYVGGVISDASNFGFSLVSEFGTRNVIAGKTEAEIDAILENPDMLKIGMALMSGSLKYARRKIFMMEPFSGVSQTDKDWMIAELDKYLGV